LHSPGVGFVAPSGLSDDRNRRAYVGRPCQGRFMVSRTANFCIDAHNPRAQAQWWAQVIDDFRPEDDDDDPDPDETGLHGPAGRWLLFLRVPEAKTVKNRMHICLRPVDRTRDEEVERILGLGATMVNDLRDGARGWAVLADPEGNEFCVLSTSAADAGIALA
jgi:hypothetical protein